MLGVFLQRVVTPPAITARPHGTRGLNGNTPGTTFSFSTRRITYVYIYSSHPPAPRSSLTLLAADTYNSTQQKQCHGACMPLQLRGEATRLQATTSTVQKTLKKLAPPLTAAACGYHLPRSRWRLPLCRYSCLRLPLYRSRNRSRYRLAAIATDCTAVPPIKTDKVLSPAQFHNVTETDNAFEPRTKKKNEQSVYTFLFSAPTHNLTTPPQTIRHTIGATPAPVSAPPSGNSSQCT